MESFVIVFLFFDKIMYSIKKCWLKYVLNYIKDYSLIDKKKYENLIENRKNNISV